MTDLLAWLVENTTTIAATAGTAAAILGFLNLIIHVKQNRQLNRINPELIASIVTTRRDDGLRQLRLSPAVNSEHRFQYHCIRRAGWFWWPRQPCMSHAKESLKPTDPSVWRRKLHFRPPVGNIGMGDRVIFVSQAMPRPVTLVIKFAGINDNTRIRKHKILVN